MSHDSARCILTSSLTLAALKLRVNWRATYIPVHFLTSFAGQDDPNVRELVDRLQKYHNVVEKEFTGQKARKNA